MVGSFKRMNLKIRFDELTPIRFSRRSIFHYGRYNHPIFGTLQFLMVWKWDRHFNWVKLKKKIYSNLNFFWQFSGSLLLDNGCWPIKSSKRKHSKKSMYRQRKVFRCQSDFFSLKFTMKTFLKIDRGRVGEISNAILRRFKKSPEY